MRPVSDLLCILLACAWEVGSTCAMSRASPLVVLDVDTGVDDAMAIMLARSLGARILAITCVAGNTDLERAYNNTLRVLGLVEETRVCRRQRARSRRQNLRFHTP